MSSLWHEPALPAPPTHARSSVLLVLVVALAIVAEGLLRPDLPWRVWPTVVVLALSVGLYWRQRYPLWVLLITFHTFLLLECVAYLRAIAWHGMWTQVYVLMLPYALVRRGSARHIVLGLGITTGSYVLWKMFDPVNWADHVAGLAVYLLPALLAAVVRLRERSVQQQLEQLTLRERTQLARNVHDTVSHAMSAIAVQAQAGIAVAAKHPEQAAEALENIELTARQALVELRSVVRALRNDDPVDTEPAVSLADVLALVQHANTAIAVHIEHSGPIDDVSSEVAAAVYRVVQESITNTVRHAQQASRVEVTLSVLPDQVRVEISDDGAKPPDADIASPGYGIQGMVERVTLLGGHVHAGWNMDSTDTAEKVGLGWRVVAEFPRSKAQK